MFKFNVIKFPRKTSEPPVLPLTAGVDRARLLEHIADLEKGLAAYVARYGLTDEARRLFFKRKF